MWSPEQQVDFSKDQASIFLLAAWYELFHGFTPDSYQPRLHNVASLVEELVDISDHKRRDARFQPHIGKIQNELEAAVKSEDGVLLEIPTYRSRVVSLTKAKTPEAIIAGGEILIGEREFYWDTFERHATASIGNLPGRKSNALDSIRSLATFAFQQGKEDNDVWEPLDKTTSRNPSDVFRDMITLTQEDEKEYTCTLSIIGDIQEMHSVARKQGYKIVARDSLPPDYSKDICSPGNQTLHVQMAVQGRSIRHAVAAARRNLSTDLGFMSLCTSAPGLRLHSTALVSSSKQNRVFVQTEQAFRRLHPRSNSKRDIKEAIDLISDHEVDRRVLAAVEQLALACASTDTRTRFVNLWSAVETLAGAHEGETTLSRVCDLIVPLVISRHVHRTTRYITILTQRFGDSTCTCDFGSGFRKASGSAIRLDDMLGTLTSKCGSAKILDLLKFAKHPLLRFRIYNTWQTFHAPRTLLCRLRDSKIRLEWQIARIYRARNLLVHEGKEVPFIVPLLDNLQNYLSTLVQRLIHELKSHSNWKLRNLIEYWNGRMMHAMHILEKCPHRLTTRDFLESGDSLVLWPT